MSVLGNNTALALKTKGKTHHGSADTNSKWFSEQLKNVREVIWSAHLTSLWFKGPSPAISNCQTLYISHLLIFNEKPTLTTALWVNQLCQMGTTQPHHQQGKPRDCYWSSASGILHRDRHFLIGEEGLTWVREGAQIGMDFSNLLLMVKGERTHTGVDEICFCLMAWGRRGDWWNGGGDAPPPPPSCQYQLRLQHTAQSSMFSTVGLIWEGREGQQSHAQDVSERMGQSNPKFFFSWPPSMLGLNCRLRNPSNYGFSWMKWKLHTLGIIGLTQGTHMLLWLLWAALAKTRPHTARMAPSFSPLNPWPRF